MKKSDVVERDTLDYTDANTTVARARDKLRAGDDKEAARLLADAAYQTRDPEIERQVRELAALGLERAGRFSRGRWNEIIRTVDSLQAMRG
jgi:IS5 family transposase